MILAIGMARGRKPGMAFGLGCAVGCLSSYGDLRRSAWSALIAACPLRSRVENSRWPLSRLVGDRRTAQPQAGAKVTEGARYP